MAIVRLATPAEVRATLDRLQRTSGDALLLFFGSEDPGTGASWCPDCVIADPILRRACATLQGDLTLYECPVGERQAWKQRPEHPYRTDPDLHVERIPTLIRVRQGILVGRLVEADCQQRDLVAAFLSA
jgi:hypothetical protein